MFVRINHGPKFGHTCHIERNQTTQLLLDLGLIEIVQAPAPPAPSTVPRFFYEESTYTGAPMLSVVLPSGEKRSYAGDGDSKTAAAFLGAGEIPEAIFSIYERKRKATAPVR